MHLFLSGLGVYCVELGSFINKNGRSITVSNRVFVCVREIDRVREKEERDESMVWREIFLVDCQTNELINMKQSSQ